MSGRALRALNRVMVFPEPGGAAQHQRFVLGQPGVQQGLVANSVQRGNRHLWGCHLVGLHLDLGHLALP